MNFGEIFTSLISLGIKIAIAIAILFMSFRLINVVLRKLEQKLRRRGGLDKTISSTLSYVLSATLKILVVLSLIGYLGIDVSGITALIASLGVGVGLAVNGALSNLAGGVLLLITRPFKIDDFIEAEGFSGTVEDIRVTVTRLRTPDNKVVYIPNGKLSSDILINYSEKLTRRLDLAFTISYESSTELAISIISTTIKENPLAMSAPEPNIKISEYKDSGIEIIARPWVLSQNYWQLRYELIEAIGRNLRQRGIVIPYNQLDVHIKSDERSASPSPRCNL